MIRILVVGLFVLASFGTSQKIESPYTTAGRIETTKDNKILLIGSASSISFNFRGKNCSISLQSAVPNHNYVSLELDGDYIGRYRVETGSAKDYNVPVSKNYKQHTLRIFKATEAANGAVIFNGAKAENITKFKIGTPKKVEFIGNSITSGMGNDVLQVPCDKGEWFDQHNAYWAYGPILSRSLKFDFLLSSVSGIGIYRNWNDEGQTEPIMPDVYENLYLNKDTSKKFDAKYQPDLVSIGLGTNDLSDGDGRKPRLPFNEKKYVSNYVNFIKKIYKRYPKTRIVLITSPMISGKKNTVLVKCLKEVISDFASDKTHKPIELFEFKPMTPQGCGNHPDISDHRQMAQQLEPVFKRLLELK